MKNNSGTAAKKPRKKASGRDLTVVTLVRMPVAKLRERKSLLPGPLRKYMVAVMRARAMKMPAMIQAKMSLVTNMVMGEPQRMA